MNLNLLKTLVYHGELIENVHQYKLPHSATTNIIYPSHYFQPISISRVGEQNIQNEGVAVFHMSYPCILVIRTLRVYKVEKHS